MAADRVYPDRKVTYFAKFNELLVEYKNILLVNVDMVGSNQLQKIRKSLRGKAVLILGKNTMARRVIHSYVEAHPQSKLTRLLAQASDGTYTYLRGNIGLIFTNLDPKYIRDVATSEKVPAAARAGNIAPVDVFIPPGPTGLDPGQTGFFQALNIATKIVKGAVEIINQVHLIKKGDKVGTSEVALLDKLGVKPFSYGLVVQWVYEDGAIYGPDILDISNEEMLKKFTNAVSKITALSVAISYPTTASLPFLFSNAFSKLLSLSLATDIEFEQAKQFKEYLANPEKFAAAAAPAAGAAAPAAGAAKKEEEKPAKKEEEEEEEMGGGMGGLFGDD